MAEGTELGKAFVQIVPSARGLKGSTESIMNDAAASAGKSSGLKIAGGIKAAIAGAGIAVAVKKSLDAGAALQQSYLGGLDTLYGEAAEGARKYADEAYKAGISMNAYSEQAVSFGAALKAAYGGDTTKAMEAANTAIMDMADNSAKMGTPLESVQAAYQGFAKGQYQLLDNLKLGYGGTKTEMERLLSDAEKLTGVKYDINNLGDVYDAVHAIQGDLGLTGVAAEEASQTLSGSFGAMKAAAENFMGSLSLGQGVEESMTGLVETASTFLFDNLLPALGNILKGLPVATMTFIKQGVPKLIEAGGEFINGIIEGASQKIPEFINKAPEMITQFGNYISTKGGELLAQGQALMARLGEGIAQKGPDLLAKGGQIVVQIAQGIWQSIPSILSKAGEMLSSLVSYISENLPTFAKKGGEILKNLLTGFIQNLPSIIGAVAKFGLTLVKNILKLAGSLIKSGAELIGSLVKGLGGSALKLVSGAAEKIKTTLMKPIEKGKELIKGIIDKIKGFFNFHISLPHVKLPHFGITPKGWKISDLLEGKIPKLGIEWYSKAKSSPRMFSDATLFGAGEAGDEILYGRQNLMNDIERAASAGTRPVNNTFYITVNGTEDPETWASKFARRMKMEMRTV